MRRGGAEEHRVALVPDRAQLRQRADVDQQLGLREPQVEHRPERLAARDELRAVPAAREQPEGRVERPRLLVVERCRLHRVPDRAAAIAASSRRGVIGHLGHLDAESASASFTAFAIAAGGAIAPPSPMPFWPKSVSGDGVSMCSMRDRRHLGRARQHVVGKRRSERLPLRVERHLLVERGADALRGAAEHLPVDDHRVHQRAAVLDDDVVEDLDRAGLGVDRDRARRGRRS